MSCRNAGETLDLGVGYSRDKLVSTALFVFSLSPSDCSLTGLCEVQVSMTGLGFWGVSLLSVALRFPFFWGWGTEPMQTVVCF